MKRLLLAIIAWLAIAAPALADYSGPATPFGFTPAKIFNPVDYGAKCDGVTNDLTALNNMTAALRAVGYGVIQGPSAFCYFSGGTLNLENFEINGSPFSTQNRIKVDLRLECSNPGGVCVSAIGSRNLDYENFVLATPHLNNCNAGDDANIGLQVGRPTPAQTAASNAMYAPNIAGCFSYAALDNYASEVFTVFGGSLYNSSMTSGANVFRADCDNHFNTLSAIQSITWTSGTFASCNSMSFNGTTVGSRGQYVNTNAGTSAGTATLTFNTVSFPSSIVNGDVVSDRTNAQYQIIPYGTTVSSISAGGGTTTVTLSANVGGAGVSSGDQISFGVPGNYPLWLDGVDGFDYTGPEGYIFTTSNYAAELCIESSQPPKFVDLNTHIEQYPNMIADILVGCTSGQSIYHLERRDFFDEASFAIVVPDFANGINTVELDDVDWRLNPAGGVASTFTDFGLYQGLSGSQTVASGGTCPTNNTFTFTLQGGLGTAATVSGTVSGNALSGAITIVTAGAYFPLLLPGSTPSLSGGGCSVPPTLNAAYANLATQTPIAFANGESHLSSGAYNSVPAAVSGMSKLYGTGASAVTSLWGASIGVPNLGNFTGGQVACQNTSNQLARSCAAATNVTQTTLQSPTGTTSSTNVMMGIAAANTPGKKITNGESVRITISGDAYNTTLGDGGNIQIYYGTGTAPSNGVAFTGTACGKPVVFTSPTASAKVPFAVSCWASGLASGTAIWTDVGLAAVTGGTASVENITVVEQET